MNQKVEIGAVFSAKNGSLAQVVTFLPKYRAIVRTYHPKAANDFLYDEEVSISNLVSGCFSSANTPNQFGGYIGSGVFNTSPQRVYHAWYNTLRYAFFSGRNIHKSWYDYQKFAEWYVSYSSHMNRVWKLDYLLLSGQDCVVSADSTCLLPAEVRQAIRINKVSRIAKKVSNSFRISDSVNLGVASSIAFLNMQSAVDMYCHLKEERVKALAEQYKKDLPMHVYLALKSWKCCVDVN